MSGVTAFQLLGKLAIDGIDETKKALDDVAKEGEQAKDKLSVSFQDIGNKAGELGKKMALGLAGVVTASIAGVEATREFRQDYGKLETTFQTTNQAAGTAEKTFTTLFGILGEDDTAIETANHLAMMTNNEKDLSQWTDVLTGVYATFGDSLPLEGLAEAANETARVGAVTGPLADALNWAGVSEDEFNKKLEKCTTTQERERLIRETLNGLYGEASATYKDVNGNVIANNEAQAQLNMQLADATAKLEPLITQGKLFLAEVLLKLQPVITWVIDNINILAPIVLGFMTTLFALNIASKVQKFIPIVKALFTLLKANPIGLVITAISLLVTAFIYLWNNCEGFRNFWIKLWEKIQSAFKTAVNGIKAGIETVKNFFSNLKDNVSSKINSLKDSVSNTFNQIKDKMSKPVEKARDVIKGIVDKIKGFFNFTFKLPNIKLPRFSIKPAGWKIGDLLEGSIPKLGITWNAEGAIFRRPTIFSTNNGLQGVGEAGAEAVAPISKLMDYTRIAVDDSNKGLEIKLDKMINLLNKYLSTLSNQQVVLNTGELVGALTYPLDKSLGQLADDRRRGR